jgi:hypothetical protein
MKSCFRGVRVGELVLENDVSVNSKVIIQERFILDLIETRREEESRPSITSKWNRLQQRRTHFSEERTKEIEERRGKQLSFTSLYQSMVETSTPEWLKAVCCLR